MVVRGVVSFESRTMAQDKAGRRLTLPNRLCARLQWYASNELCCFSLLTLVWFQDALSGSWTRNERRANQGSQETLNTFGSFSMKLSGSCFEKQAIWSPKNHRFFVNELFRVEVFCLLMLRSKSDSCFSWLPRDVLYLVIQQLADLYPQHEGKFESLMLTEPDGRKLTVDELILCRRSVEERRARFLF